MMLPLVLATVGVQAAQPPHSDGPIAAQERSIRLPRSCDAKAQQASLSNLSESDAAMLLTSAGSSPRIGKVTGGFSITGVCAPAVSSLFPAVVFGGTDFYGIAYPTFDSLIPTKPFSELPDPFTPPSTVRKLKGAKFELGGVLRYGGGIPFETHQRLSFWSNSSGSVIGLIDCLGSSATPPCTIGNILYRTKHRVRKVSYTPSMHSTYKQLRFWITERTGRQDYVEADYLAAPR
ncbi:hypothetical protein FHS94_000034 [Sphingomonas aerophila]|uniref:Uncharacterized protein n=1 Tax=Sphingomonas aerophila TaxID=1344948 RepID=A0A7W9B9T0_9SPHN|nr:hypothetical protein [Sphingomonas aerophila]